MKFHESKARYRVMALGRQAGKSTACVNELVFKAWVNPNQTFWFISPTYEQAKVQYRRMCQLLDPCKEIVVSNNISELRIVLLSGSSIQFKSGDNMESLRGETLNGVVIDEVREQDQNLWQMVVRPMITTTNGWAAFVSTPNGFDQFYDLAKTAQEDKSGLWEYFKAPSTCNPFFTQQEYDLLKQEMTEAVFAQEILAEFLHIFTGRAYQFTEANIAENNPFHPSPVSPYLPIVIGLDFNVNPMAWTLGQSRAGHWYWFDEIFVRNTTTMECAQILVSKILMAKEHGLRADPSVILVGDPAGKSRNTKSTESDFNIIEAALKKAGISFSNQTPEAHPPIKERVNTVNSHLKSADGLVKMWVNRKCKQTIYDLERCSWKEGDQVILDKSNPDLTHMTDALGYALAVLSPLTGVKEIGTLRVIRR
jgi:hypothetical protein